MGSITVRGFHNEVTDEWQLMKDAYDACKAAGIPVPDEVWEYFGNMEPGDGPMVEFGCRSGDGGDRNRWKSPAFSNYDAEMVVGVDIDLSKIPPGIRRLRVTYTY